SGGMDGRPPVRYIASKVGDSSARARSAKRLIVRSGWWGGTRSSRSTNANMLACGFRRPRILTAPLSMAASTVAAGGDRPEEPESPEVGVFHQPANEASLGPPSSRGTLHPHAALRQRVT